jgi:hypothetical protein
MLVRESGSNETDECYVQHAKHHGPKTSAFGGVPFYRDVCDANVSDLTASIVNLIHRKLIKVIYNLRNTMTQPVQRLVDFHGAPLPKGAVFRAQQNLGKNNITTHYFIQFIPYYLQSHLHIVQGSFGKMPT